VTMLQMAKLSENSLNLDLEILKGKKSGLDG
jgi:hypothetical protein